MGPRAWHRPRRLFSPNTLSLPRESIRERERAVPQAAKLIKARCLPILLLGAPEEEGPRRCRRPRRGHLGPRQAPAASCCLSWARPRSCCWPLPDVGPGCSLLCLSGGRLQAECLLRGRGGAATHRPQPSPRGSLPWQPGEAALTYVRTQSLQRPLHSGSLGCAPPPPAPTLGRAPALSRPAPEALCSTA